MDNENKSQSVEERKLREVSIDYSEFDYIGVDKFKANVVLNLREADGSRTIVLRIPNIEE